MSKVDNALYIPSELLKAQTIDELKQYLVHQYEDKKDSESDAAFTAHFRREALKGFLEDLIMATSKYLQEVANE
ncbi:MAG: hypothetical protein IJS28_06970 [Synergistaceae bacterium]|nr:hypothetical protein [Synergistaceae bacterium]